MTGPLFGLMLPPGAGTTAAEIAARGIEAEEAGFDSAWVIEDYYSWECFSSLGYLAAVTKRVELGVSVTTPYIRPAALLASSSATLDQFSGGRFRLGLGRCTGPLLHQIGIEDRLPLTTLEETTLACRAYWKGGEVSFHGKTVEIDRVYPDLTPVGGSIPIAFGAIGPKALQKAGAVADGVILTSFAPVPYVRHAVEQVRIGAEAAGRDPKEIRITAMIAVRLSDDKQAAIDELKPWLGLGYGMTGRGEMLLTGSDVDLTVLEPIREVLKVEEIVAEGLEPYVHTFKRVDPADVVPAVPDSLVEAAAIVGNAADCRRQLAAFVDAGVDEIIIDSPQPAKLLIDSLRG
jgi:5,10-methylenetetrahydromethanopterin reductase